MVDPRLHPDIRSLLARRAALGLKPYSAGTPAEARQAFAVSQAALAPGRGADVASTVDQALPVPGGSITVRRYRPNGEPRGLIVYLHGGGWVFGTLDAFDPVCRELAAASGAEVASVDYRMAPEHRFPGPLDDAWAALRVLAAEDESRPLAVMGDSAGGNLAAALALRARDAGGPRIDLQVLLYPIVDHDESRASYGEFGGGEYLLSADDMAWYWRHYAEPCLRSDPQASPLRATDLAGLPPAIIVVAGCDPLRDEGLAYAEVLRAAGVPVDLRRHDDMIHGFFTMVGSLDTADREARAVGAEIGRRFASA